ncbi:MAG: MipA/OmpV family protein [Pseudomonadota bacterium]
MLIAALAAASALATPVAAVQGPPGPPGQTPTGWTFSAGFGGFYAPAFQGADEYQLIAAPNISVAYGTRFSFSPQGGARFVALRNGGLEAGPIARVDFGRPEDGDNPLRIAGQGGDDLQGLGDVDPTPEFGGFVTYRTRPFTVSLEARQGVGGHEGFVADAAVRAGRPLMIGGRRVIASAGPRLRVGSEDYAQTFFGVTEVQSARSGLRAYDADGAFFSYGFGATATLPFGKRAAATFIAGYDRLGETAADSPIVDDLGSADQFAVGALVTWRFGGGARR